MTRTTSFDTLIGRLVCWYTKQEFSSFGLLSLLFQNGQGHSAKHACFVATNFGSLSSQQIESLEFNIWLFWYLVIIYFRFVFVANQRSFLKTATMISQEEEYPLMSWILLSQHKFCFWTVN